MSSVLSIQPPVLLAFEIFVVMTWVTMLVMSVGGDSDTLAAITGSIAEAYYRDIPYDLRAFAKSKLPDDIQVALGMI